jgi:precorrin-3B C17-methyltransferase
MALAEIRGHGKEWMKRDRDAAEQHTGRIYIVGTGPGDMKHITPLAQDAIKKSDIIVGYTTYLTLIEGLIKGKEIFSTGMTREVDRCRKAVELAKSGKSVSVISGGDPGVYAMAGLVFELLRADEQKSGRAEEKASGPAVEVIPGISALNACAARLGAPLMHDFASISLSDRLTSWDLIEKRLEAASMADFVIVIYNPKSMGRIDQIRKAQEIILKHRSSETPVGIVKGAMRENEKVVLTTLGEMLGCDIDMQTTVIVGNSKTFKWNDWMITPRGYDV